MTNESKTNRRILGIDPGATRIGVALSDPLGLTAQPLETIRTRSRPEAVAKIRRIARRHDVGTIVIGMPYLMDGTEGEQALWVRGFADLLRERMHDVEIVFHDERLSSEEADEVLRKTRRPGETRKEDRDRIAAALILQDYLEERRKKMMNEE